MTLLSALAGLMLAASAASQPAPETAEPATAIFAGGCFWCVESDFEKLPGVLDAVSGYSGGLLDNPTYQNHAGHLETVRVTYDPARVSFRQLADYHLRHIDPLDDGGQFCDRGEAYKSALFAGDADEFSAAQAALAEAAEALGKPVVTPVRDRMPFWVAEDYHQDYAKKNPIKYRYYRSSCGRDKRVKRVWGEKD